MKDTGGQTGAPTAFLLPPEGMVIEEGNLFHALTARRLELQLTIEIVAAIAGWEHAYTSKIFRGDRKVTLGALWCLLPALGLRLRLEPDLEALERVRKHHLWVPSTRARRYHLPDIAIARRRNAPWLWNREKAREYGRKGAATNTAKRNAAALISQRNRENALQRWRKSAKTAEND